ncbi:hypothetical protein Cch01nite_23510 [Cellulomonas chitinilytica]|uniref:Uncharacterized protein n=1 Tax=Cellulomonas chitinilytica TaxID=398759 RepID=A0A919P1M7_9CELL|nr:hypothetical protein [Cellulomonas chitinilytica]GIG21627.1 hypothetical protein Cch01nite_23510 [Cellulomonas chitinilytica]
MSRVTVASKLGEHAELVEKFVQEVRSSTQEDWQRYLARLDEGVPGRRKVFSTLEPGLGAAVESAVDKAANDAYLSLGLSSELFPDHWARFISLQTDVIAAALVIAAGDRVPPESRRVVLGPFADVGFTAPALALSGAAANEPR